MKYISESELAAKLADPSNLANVIHKKRYNGSRPVGSHHPEEFKVMIGAIVGPSKETVAKEFGIGRSTVNLYRNGKIATGQVDPEFKKKVQAVRGEVEQVALERTMDFLQRIGYDMTDTSKLDSMKLGEKISATKDLSHIARNMRSEESGRTASTVVIVNHGEKQESRYETVEIDDFTVLP